MKNLKSFLVILISLITISSCNEVKTHKGVWEREVNQVENIQEKDSIESALLEVQGEKSSEIVKEQKEEVKLTKEATIVSIIFVSCTIALFLYMISVLFSGFLKR